MQEVMGNEDLAAAILGAIRAADGKSVCAMAKAWCATGPAQAAAGRKSKDAWRTLLQRAFEGAPAYEGDEPRVRFNAMCHRIEQYENGSLVFPTTSMYDDSFGGHDENANYDDSDTRVRAFVLAAVQHNPWAILKSPFVASDRELVQEAVTRDAFLLRSLPQWAPQFQNDRAFALAAVTQNGATLEILPRFQKDLPLVLAAVRSNPAAWIEASNALRKRREIVLAAVRGSGDMLYFMAPVYKADKEIVLAALAESPDALMFASEDLQRDPDVMRAAQEGWDSKRRGNDVAWNLFIFGMNRRGLSKFKSRWPHRRFDRRGQYGYPPRKVASGSLGPDIDPRDR